MSTKRLETLVDGIFAIAMTILVLGLAVPHLTGELSNNIVQTSYYMLLPNVFAFILSFLLLAAFWTGHHRVFNQIGRVNSTLLWINMVWLLFIVMVPFSASSIGEYGSYIIPNLIFNINMLGIAVLLLLNLLYATHNNLLINHANFELLNYSKKFIISFVFIGLLALILSFFIYDRSTIVYALLIPLGFIIKKFAS